MENEVFRSFERLMKHRNKSLQKMERNLKFIENSETWECCVVHAKRFHVCNVHAIDLKSRILQLHFDLQPSRNLTPKYFVQSRKREQSCALKICWRRLLALPQIIYCKSVSLLSSSLSKTFSITLHFISNVFVCVYECKSAQSAHVSLLFALSLEYRYFSLIFHTMSRLFCYRIVE